MNSKYSFVMVVCVFASSLFLAANQGQNPQWKGTIEYEGRVKVINNPKEPMYGENIFGMEEELSIETKDIKQAEEMFQTIVSLAIDDKGNIFVLDKRARNVKVFDKEGKFLKTFGRKGDGPGEFGTPERCALTPNNELYIHDSGHWAVHVFDIEGNFKKKMPVKMPFFEGPKFLTNGEMIVSYGVLGEKPIFELKKFDSDMNPVLSITSIPIQKPPRVHVFVYYTASDLKWDVSCRDEIIWGVMTTPEYELFVHDTGGKNIKKITKEYDPVNLSKKEYEKLMTKWFGKVPTPPKWDLIIPANYPPFQGFYVDDEGRIFVKRFVEVENGDKHHLDVFDEEGRYITNITLDISLQFGMFRHKKFFTIEEDKEGFQVVKRYKVSWNYYN